MGEGRKNGGDEGGERNMLTLILSVSNRAHYQFVNTNGGPVLQFSPFLF